MLRFLIGLMLLAVAAPAAAQGVAVQFCPEAIARPYPLDSLRGVQGLNLQNVAVVNATASAVEIEAVEIELLQRGAAVDRRILAGPALTAALRSAAAIKAQGLMQLMAFQFCDSRLLGSAGLATSPVLQPGEALLVMQQVFAWKGARDELKVTARLKGATAVTATIRLDGAVSRTVFRFPLERGVWLVGSGASFHTTHRWAVPEEFALDIIRIGADGRSFRTDGARHEDFLAYSAKVVAAAAGTVVQVVTGAKQAPPLLRKPGEAMDAYYGRIGVMQAANLAAGPAGVVGEAVVIDHGGEYSVYAHLAPGSVTVRVGQAVKAGEVVGRLGSSGNSTEPHLHFQVCDRPSAVSCAGLIPNFADLDIANTDGPRPLQSGDLVRVP